MSGQKRIFYILTEKTYSIRKCEEFILNNDKNYHKLRNDLCHILWGVLVNLKKRFQLNKYISVNVLNLQGQKENWTNRKKSSKLSGRKIWLFCVWAKASKTDMFRDKEEGEIEERVEKRKKKRQEFAEQNKSPKRQKKQGKRKKMRQNYGLT